MTHDQSLKLSVFPCFASTPPEVNVSLTTEHTQHEVGCEVTSEVRECGRQMSVVCVTDDIGLYLTVIKDNYF